jgi:selenide,water dikinase
VELLERGFASSLAPANAAALALLEGPIQLRSVGEGVGERSTVGRTGLLIDPQTCGPLLAALPAERAGGALEAMVGVGFGDAAVIGTVSGPGGPGSEANQAKTDPHGNKLGS